MEFIKCHFSIFRGAFGATIDRFTQFVREKSTRGSSYLEMLSRLDPEEAQSLLLALSEGLPRDGSIQARLDYDFPYMLRACYAPLLYTQPHSTAWLQEAPNRMAEKGKTTTLSPLMRYLESRGGPFIRRQVPVLDVEGVTDVWWGILRGNGTTLPPQDISLERRIEEDLTAHRDAQCRNRIDRMLQSLQSDPEQRQSTGYGDPDDVDLPGAPSPNPNPRVVGTLSRPLHGDNRYLLDKICDDFDPRWSAHLPADMQACSALRTILTQSQETVGEEVALTIDMIDGCAVPLAMGRQ